MPKANVEISGEEVETDSAPEDEEKHYSIYVKGPDFAHVTHRVTKKFAKELVDSLNVQRNW